ncbi:GAF domain-containing protein [Streptomyces olivoreticuli]
MRTFLRWLRKLWAAGTLLAGLGNVAAYLLQSDWTHRLPNAIAGAVCTLVAVALPAKKAKDLVTQEEAIRNDERDNALQMFRSLVDEVAGISYAGTMKGRSEKRRKLKQAAVSAATRIGPRDTRAAFYDLKTTKSKGRYLRCNEISHGRDGHPDTEFPAARADEDYMYDLMSPSWTPLVIDNVREAPRRGETDPPTAWMDPKCDYASFVAVQVRKRGKAVGILALDNPRQGELRRDHAHMLNVIAKLLASGLRLIGVK